MKIEYAISIDDFRALQGPFTGRAGANAGFKGILAACGAVAALGIYCLIAGLGLPAGAFLMGLAVSAGIASYFLDVRVIRKAKEKYENNIVVGYQRLHCRDGRTVEFDENNFTVACKCGVVTRPWSELTQFSENDRFFQVKTKGDGLLLPKHAFPGEGDRTEFRRIATDHINKNRAFASRPIEYVCSAAEQRSARLLHIVRGGGWRLVLRFILILAGISVLLNFFLRSYDRANSSVTSLLTFGAVLFVFLAVTFVRNLRVNPRNRVPLRAHFGSEGLHFQDQITIARYPWDGFCGYLENDRIFLLYHNPRLYRVIPKRALGSREAEFRGLVEQKLAAYDYRNPVRVESMRSSNSV